MKDRKEIERRVLLGTYEGMEATHFVSELRRLGFVVEPLDPDPFLLEAFAEPACTPGLGVELEADPERCRRASARNTIHSLLRHDWVHRWAAALHHVGLAPTRAMEARRQALRDRARLVAGETGVDLPPSS